MSDLDIRTKNILIALENFLTDSNKHLDQNTHQDIVNTLIKHVTQVLDDYRLFKDGSISSGSYRKSLTRLAEITLLGVRRLP